MDFFKVICKRTSIRKYKSELISRNILKKLVDSGRRAPSARAVEPWEFVVVQNSETLIAIAKLASNGSFIKNAQVAIIIFSIKTKYYLEDGCAATENILLAAAALGLGACWIAGDKKDYAADIGKLLKIPEDLVLVSIIAVGALGENKIQAKKRELNDVIHWDFFNKGADK